MAEERILILSVKPFCEDEIAYEDIDVHMEDLPTRTEAIERMAKAICENVCGSFWENASEKEKQNSLIYAEAAWDALIKGE